MNASATLSRQRCWTHPAREAAARCPACERFFCRECVTEHEGRFLCAGCLRTLLVAAKPVDRQRVRRAVAAVRRVIQVAASVLLTWFFFYLFARMLVSLPADFHEGTLWRNQLLGTDGGEP